MSFDTNWDIEQYRDDHESEDHWLLRKAFMERWKSNYPEERLVCLARVFSNIEFMGCRYPHEVMQEVATLSRDVAKSYRDIKKTKLQRTFVSASDAAEDRAKGIKRAGGVIVDEPKKSKISFVAQGQTVTTEKNDVLEIESSGDEDDTEQPEPVIESQSSKVKGPSKYLDEMLKLDCLDVRQFRESMFHTTFGRLVLLIRTWISKLQNILISCQHCGINVTSTFENGSFSLYLNGKLLAQATGENKSEAKSIVEIMAWERLRREAVSIVIKEQFTAQKDSRISVSEVMGGGQQQSDMFGSKIESSVAIKMMKMMGWKGGGLGAEAQGIAEPIKPNMQLVNRAGLGSQSELDPRQLRQAAFDLMRRFIASDSFDIDLVFSSEFTKEERAQLHQYAAKVGLASRSYGGEKDRFLVVKKKFNPFDLVRAVVEKGGISLRFQVFIPRSFANR